jgi:hypothetical protein
MSVGGEPLSAQGHIFVLTSKESVVLPNLASRFAYGEPLDCPSHYRHKAINSVDAFVSRGRELLIPADDGVSVFEIPKLVNGHSETGGAIESPEIPVWVENHEAPALLDTEWHNLVA